ncbi:EGF-like domain-containing protein [Tieghemostelium lacteum]|uniref:peptidylprolyl isomerase n=1 Tax=Tieghemostelium lacteum TaxID=361077 RepID=A0A151ZJT8_TIELA|nr:EGF-like domain-containing protein [Tieghemostelium lacteum]|eukprot:KYQ94243.1 EGF-like domain-containing protein [Tieghemostelium lacteum]
MFWGIEVTATQPVKFTPPYTLHITNACLGVNLKASEERNVLQVKIDGVTHCICSLRLGGAEHFSFDTIMEEGKEVIFSVSGKNSIHLTGYFVDSMLNEEDSDEEESDLEDDKALMNGLEGEDDEDDEDDEDEMDFDDDSDDDDEEEFSISEADQKIMNEILASGSKRKAAAVEPKGQPTQKQLKLETPTKKDQPQQAKKEATPQKKDNTPQKKQTTPEPVSATSKQSPNKKEQPQQQKPAAEKKKEEIGGKTVTLKSGLQYQDVMVGTGPQVVPGKTVTVHYTGKLTNGKVFDSSVRSGRPFPFRLGAGEVIKGWDMGVAGMKVGGKRTLICPPSLAYGSKSLPGIPANSTLIFDVEVLKGVMKNILFVFLLLFSITIGYRVVDYTDPSVFNNDCYASVINGKCNYGHVIGIYMTSSSEESVQSITSRGGTISSFSVLQSSSRGTLITFNFEVDIGNGTLEVTTSTSPISLMSITFDCIAQPDWGATRAINWYRKPNGIGFTTSYQFQFQKAVGLKIKASDSDPYFCVSLAQGYDTVVIDCSLSLIEVTKTYNSTFGVTITNRYLDQISTAIPTFVNPGNSLSVTQDMEYYLTTPNINLPSSRVFYQVRITNYSDYYIAAYKSHNILLPSINIFGNQQNRTLLAIDSFVPPPGNTATFNNIYTSVFFYNSDYKESATLSYSTNLEDDSTTQIAQIASNSYVFRGSTIISYLPTLTRFTFTGDSNVNDFLVNDRLDYPYGVISRSLTTFLFTYHVEVNFVTALRSSYYFGFNTTPLNYAVNSGVIDIVKPSIVDVNYIDLDGMTMIIQVSATDDISGVFEIRICPYDKGGNIVLGTKDIVSGSTMNGTWEKYIDYSDFELYFSLRTIQFNIRDLSGNLAQVTYVNAAPIPLFPKLTSTSDYIQNRFKISSLVFQQSTMDVSISDQSNTLYVNFTNANIYSKIKLSLDSGDLKANGFRGAWDKVKKLFVINFVVKARAFEGPVYFTLTYQGFVYSSAGLSSYGINVTPLSLVSTYADRMPPQVSSIQASPALASVTGGIISWTLNVTDTHNGIKNITFFVTSNLDPLSPIIFNYLPTGSPKDFQSQNVVPIVPQCQNQVFSISYMELVDSSNQVAIYDKYNLYTTPTDTLISPFLEILDGVESLLSIQVSCAQSLPNEQLPYVSVLNRTIITLDVGSLTDRQLNFSFAVTSALYQMSSTHIPTCYLQGSIYQKLSSKSSLVQSQNQTAIFSCSFDVPYGFGLPLNFIMFSVFGYSDVNLNIGGSTSYALMAYGRDPRIPILYTPHSPVIEKVLPFSSRGGDITIVGYNFPRTTDITSIIAYNDRDTGTVTTVYPNEYKVFQTQTMVVFTGILPDTNPFKIILQSFYNSTVFKVTPYIDNSVGPDTPSPSPQQCFGNPPCNEGIGGTCTPNGCVCKSGYFGNDCTGKNIPNIPTINNTYPSSGSVLPESLVKTLVSIHSLRELTFDGTIVTTHRFPSWDYVNSSVSEGSNQQVHTYSTSFEYLSVQTNISIYINYFKEQQTVLFAGELLEMVPSSIKYRVEISKYQFSASLNYLELVMATSIESESSNTDSCTYLESGKTVGTNEDYVKLQINGNSLYGRFINRALIDSRIQSITNRILSNETDQTSQYFNQYIAIQIPHYKKLAILDPDFSLLIDSEDASTKSNSVCSESDSGLSRNQLIGIIVGSAIGGLIVIGLLVTIAYRHSITFRVGIHKLKKLKVNQ